MPRGEAIFGTNQQRPSLHPLGNIWSGRTINELRHAKTVLEISWQQSSQVFFWYDTEYETIIRNNNKVQFYSQCHTKLKA